MIDPQLMTASFSGIGLRRQHFTHLLEQGAGDDVDGFEIISEDLFGAGGRPWAVAERVRRDKPVILHGTGLAIGNAMPLSEEYLRQLTRVIERLEPAWVSDHLSWGAAGGVYTHELLPLPYEESVLEHVAERVNRVQERLGRRLLLENPTTYVAFRESTMAEWEFLNALVEKTGCAVLLDVNNVYVSSVNVGVEPGKYLEGIRADAVLQIHLAGHTPYEQFIMDTHVGPVPEPVWRLFDAAVRRFGPVPTIIEWDTDVPAFDTVATEAVRARERIRAALGETSAVSRRRAYSREDARA